MVKKSENFSYFKMGWNYVNVLADMKTVSIWKDFMNFYLKLWINLKICQFLDSFCIAAGYKYLEQILIKKLIPFKEIIKIYLLFINQKMKAKNARMYAKTKRGFIQNHKKFNQCITIF